jgi:hypothetical protein
MAEPRVVGESVEFESIAQMGAGEFWVSHHAGIDDEDELNRMLNYLNNVPVPGIQWWMFEVPRRVYN